MCYTLGDRAATGVDTPPWIAWSGLDVLDPFLGSGSTALAAAQLGRRYVGIELSPQYCAIASQRLGLRRFQMCLPNLKEACEVYA